MAENKSSSAKKNNKNSKSSDNNKMRLRPVWIAALGIILIVCAVVFLKSCAEGKGRNTGSASVNIIDMKADVQTIEETRPAQQTAVKIDLQSCKLVVGEKIYVTATVTPADTDKSLQWKSSDEKVFKVSGDGIVEAVGVGTAALTATVGDVSDAIVIEGVESENAKSQMDLPGYKDAKNGTADKDTDKEKETEPDAGNQNIKPSESQGEVNIPTQTVRTETKQPTTQTAAFPVIPSTTQAESRGLKSSQLPEVLGNYGYHSTGDNVYVYGEGDSYAGEIIVQPDVAIIYIKKNTEEYNSAIQSVLEELLPDEYRQAWNNYVSATTDRTFNLEGRRVRIVTAGNGGHSQIVVYN